MEIIIISITCGIILGFIIGTILAAPISNTKLEYNYPKELLKQDLVELSEKINDDSRLYLYGELMLLELDLTELKIVNNSVKNPVGTGNSISVNDSTNISIEVSAETITKNKRILPDVSMVERVNLGKKI